ncbi:MAG: TVP38/TMEM64 family protein [Opitutales bacterium]
MTREGSNNRRVKLAVLAVAGLVVLGLLAWGLRAQGGDLPALAERAVDRTRALGPGVFFGLMTLLPALGCPLTAFTIPAGSVFAPTLGMPTVLLLVWVCIAVNLTLTYWLSRHLLRPWLLRLCAWLGYRLPEVAEANHRGLVILVRVTPGPPYVLQSYLLGLAGIPFGTYFFISWVISSLYACAFVMFGDALMHGQGKKVLYSIGLFAVLTVGVQLLRRHYARRPSPP